MPKHFRLISHKLCPYVQRAVIVATEKGISFERVDIDLQNKPDWFLALSPTGKVPVLEVTLEDDRKLVLFESAVIAEYLDELTGERLLPADPLERARERAWVEFASATLADIYQLYVAAERETFDTAVDAIGKRLGQVERELVGPFFAGARFGLVDAAFAPVFRYFDVFERRAGLDLLDRHPRLRAWANALLKRPSVTRAVPGDYADLLADFIRAKGSHLAQLIDTRLPQAA
jgi:glutathione S-transferase